MTSFNQNNKYGANIMNFGIQPRKLDASLKEQLKSIIPTQHPVNLTSVLGDSEAYNFASQIKLYLEEQGYNVQGVNQAIFSGPVKGQIIEPPKTENDSYKIIIGNKE